MNDHLVRNYIDCRDFPGESKCSLRLEGTKEEVVAAATLHAVAAHGHHDGPELHELLVSAVSEVR